MANIAGHNGRETAGREAASELIGRFGIGVPSAFVVATEAVTRVRRPVPPAGGRDRVVRDQRGCRG
ncbi:hypothetical protein CA984_22655 [Streptosporangium minutum]|uniref:Uncharacterized protein n=1 Tax=Streptosporangium minutum TaxID=569862 RepID=A0A243RHR9_9ACTN|nr:hypothetical protein CA984_22655 [Streptosporangium minutum]